MTRHTQDSLNHIAASEATEIQRVKLAEMQKIGWRVTSVQGLQSKCDRAISLYHSKTEAKGWLLPSGELSRGSKISLVTMKPVVKVRRGAGSY